MKYVPIGKYRICYLGDHARWVICYQGTSVSMTTLLIHTVAHSTPGPHLVRIHLVQNSTSAIFGKSPKIHLVRILPIIHLVQKFALSE